MPNKMKAQYQKQKLKRLGPMPTKPDHVPAQIWGIATQNARRELAKTKSAEEIGDVGKKVYLPEGACVQVNGQRWIGRKFVSNREYHSLRSTMVRRSNHDRKTEAGQLGFDVNSVFG